MRQESEAELLKIQNLTAGYGNKEILRDISCAVLPDEIVGIIGPNGAGKTTLFRVITGLIKPSSGKVLYGGRDINSIPVRELACSVAVLPQTLPLTFSFTVFDFVLMGRLPHLTRWQATGETDYTIARKMMRLAEIDDLSHRYITELSGGELQKVLLAQALSQEPELLLLDEPTNHLDIGHQVDIMDLIKRLNIATAYTREGKERKLSIIMVLHDLNLAGQYCDRLILLNNGKIHSIGTPKEVLTYQNIETVYKTVVVVKDNPITQKPHIFLIPKERWK